MSIALGDAATLTRWTADIVVLGGDVRRVGDAIALARRTLAIVRQNVGWAVAYNLVAIPLAAGGLVSPLAASIGMAVSSLVVVANASRLAMGEAAGKASALPDASRKAEALPTRLTDSAEALPQH